MALLIPVLTMGWAQMGLAEASNETKMNTRDSYAILSLHLAILIPFIACGAFIVLSTIYLGLQEVCSPDVPSDEFESRNQRLHIGSSSDDSSSDNFSSDGGNSSNPTARSRWTSAFNKVKASRASVSLPSSTDATVAAVGATKERRSSKSSRKKKRKKKKRRRGKRKTKAPKLRQKASAFQFTRHESHQRLTEMLAAVYEREERAVRIVGN